MTVKQIVEITDHSGDGHGRLHQQYKDPTPTLEVASIDPSAEEPPIVTGWRALLNAFIVPAQEFETIANKMLNERAIRTAEGVNLDRIGQIVGIDRGGASDESYSNLLVGQIAANNSNATARDLLGIATILLGEDLRNLSINEIFPAKTRIDYLAEIQFTVDEFSDYLEVQTDYPSSPLLPITLAHGLFFPHELITSIEAAIEAAWGEPITVDFTALREYQFNVANVPNLVNPAIVWNNAAPNFGFQSNALIVNDNRTGAPVAGPTIDALAVQAALEQAKAAGVDVQSQAIALGTVFVFSNDNGGLGWGSLVYTASAIESQPDQSGFGFGLTTADRGNSQQFRGPGTGPMSYIRIWIQKTGAPVADIVVDIYSDIGGDPDSGTLLGTSDVVLASSLAAGLSQVTFSNFGVSLVMNTEYFFIVRYSATTTIDGGNYIQTRANTIVNPLLGDAYIGFGGGWFGPQVYTLAYEINISNGSEVTISQMLWLDTLQHWNDVDYKFTQNLGSSDAKTTSVEFVFSKVGAPLGLMQAKLYSNSGTPDGGALLATSLETIDISGIPTGNGGKVGFTFNPVNFVAYIVLEMTSLPFMDGANYLRPKGTLVSTNYGDGFYGVFIPPSWTYPGGDFAFRLTNTDVGTVTIGGGTYTSLIT